MLHMIDSDGISTEYMALELNLSDIIEVCTTTWWSRLDLEHVRSYLSFGTKLFLDVIR